MNRDGRGVCSENPKGFFKGLERTLLTGSMILSLLNLNDTFTVFLVGKGNYDIGKKSRKQLSIVEAIEYVLKL